jgi:hypothetical protein
MKSLHQIYEEIKRKYESNNWQIDEGKIRQQAWMLRDRMIFESSLSNAAASSSAAGAGGGGTTLARRLARQQQPVQVSSDQSILYYESIEGLFSYFIYNYQSNILTDIKTIESIQEGPSIYPVTRGGFLIRSYDDSNSNYKLIYLNLSGDIIWQDVTFDGSNIDVEVFSRYVAAYYLGSDGENWKLEVFDENSTRKSFTFENYIEGGGYSYDDVWSGGFVVREEIDTIQKFHIINFEQGSSTLFYEIDTDSGDSLNVYQYAFSNKILTIKNYSLLEAWSSNGTKISEFDIQSEFSTSTWYLNTFTFLDDNGSIIIFGYDDDNDNYNVIFFSGESNQFDSKTISDDFNYDYDIDGQKSYIYTSDVDPEGSALFLFYKNSNEINDIDYYEEAYLLPIWSIDSNLRDLYTFSSERGLVDVNYLSTTRSKDYINLFIDNNRGLIYYFSDYGQNNIYDGGDDMYDTGNELFADNIQINYTHTQLSEDRDSGMLSEEFISDGVVFSGVSASVFGTSSEYFTNLYPGLFVLAAQNTEIDEFKINGNLGSYGSGQFNTFIYETQLNSQTYSVFVKRVWDAQDPSVNHIIIINGSSASITQIIDETNQSDLHSLSGLLSSGVNEIYYMLLGLIGGSYLEDVKVQEIVSAFLSILDSSSDINELLDNLNLDYGNITGVLDTPDENYSILRFNRVGDISTTLPTSISKTWEYDDIDKIGGKTIITFDREVSLDNQNYGWDDLNDIEDRFYYSLRKASDGQFPRLVSESIEVVMKDVVNDKYWAIKFTNWQGGGGGAFAYTRQLIEGGTFSGDVISFTHSSYGNEIDIIEPGVLEITRGEYGPIYNIAKESESNGNNPFGTLWNSLYSFVDVSESLHNIVSLDGQIIDSEITSESYDYDSEGSTFILEDEVFSKIWISNNQNSKQFQLLEGYYNDFEDSNNISNELGLRPGNFVIKNGLKYRAITENSVSNEIEIPSTGNIFTKVDRYDIFHNGWFVITEDENNHNLYFYKLDSTLVSQKIIPNIELDDIDDYNYGKRSTIIYKRNGVENVIFFDGENISELNTNLNNIDVSINDYNWWD